MAPSGTHEHQLTDQDRGRLTHIKASVNREGISLVGFHFSTAIFGLQHGFNQGTGEVEVLLDEECGWAPIDDLPLLSPEYQLSMLACGDSMAEVAAKKLRLAEMWRICGAIWHQQIYEEAGTEWEPFFDILIAPARAVFTHLVGGNPIFQQEWRVNYSSSVVSGFITHYSSLIFARQSIIALVKAIEAAELIMWCDPTLRIRDPELTIGFDLPPTGEGMTPSQN